LLWLRLVRARQNNRHRFKPEAGQLASGFYFYDAAFANRSAEHPLGAV
jgi:hypothetical protein